MYDKNEEKIIMDLLKETRAKQEELKGFLLMSAINQYVTEELKAEGAVEIGTLINSTKEQLTKKFKAIHLLKDVNAKKILTEQINLQNKILEYGEDSKKDLKDVKILLPAVIILLATMYFVISPSSEEVAKEKRIAQERKIEREKVGDVHGAWAYAKIYVEKNLKNPSSADFPFGGAEGVSHLGNGVYSFSSYVDAQNGFGATVRKNFSGEIKRVSDGWEIVSFNFN